MYALGFKPSVGLFGVHDPSAALFEDGNLIFAAEEERYTRDKHAPNTFPERAIRACLDEADIELRDVDRIILPYKPELSNKHLKDNLQKAFTQPDSLVSKAHRLEREVKNALRRQFFSNSAVRGQLADIGTPSVDIEQKPHHKCHAASAFYPTDFEEALVLTLDGKGEYDSTVVWKADRTGVERHETFEFPNSLGIFYAVVTEFLGYRRFNGEGKVMGLAPYGEPNEDIEESIKGLIQTHADYDVTELTKDGIDGGVERLESIFGRSAKDEPVNFTDWEKDLAYVTQSILEEVVLNLTRKYTDELDTRTVCLAGGVALNCKMNKVVEQSEAVDQLFIQPVAHDGGLALGAGYLTSTPSDVSPMTDVYCGAEYENESIESILEESKLDYQRVENVPERTAEYLADGDIVGWFQGRLELGPRALGNRSILADPRTSESRDRVNKFVKHREEWRPFAPSMKEEALDEYLVDASRSPFMIKTYGVRDEKLDEIPAVLHPADNTTRPQTVSEESNPRYYALLSAFEERTGVPVLLNTSFNDHAEPIVNRPVEAIKDFYGMGLDKLVIEDFVLET